jgi:hypothetical protein
MKSAWIVLPWVALAAIGIWIYVHWSLIRWALDHQTEIDLATGLLDQLDTVKKGP